MSKKRTGRPEGAKNVTNVADVEPSRCKKCLSSARSRYRGTRTQLYSGQPFVAIIYRRCTCSNCGQVRVDREKVYEGNAKNVENNKANGLITSPVDAENA